MLVVKIGGNIVDDPEALKKFLQNWQQLPHPKILIHGGGKIATEYAKKMNLTTQMIEGRRVTDFDTLQLVTMVYGGLINKNIVAQLQYYGSMAVGICGADAATMVAHKKEHPTIDFGYIGKINTVNTTLIDTLVAQNITPVIAPLSYDNHGGLFNTNADDIAASIAIAMSKNYHVNFIYCFEKKGLLLDIDDDNSYINHIALSEIPKLKADGTISGGMLPKVDNITLAIEKGVQQVVLCHANNLLQAIEDDNTIGTKFTP